MRKKMFFCAIFYVCATFLFAQTHLPINFPKGKTPWEIGKLLSYHFLDGKHMLHVGKWISYPETFTWNGALKYAAVASDKELIKLLQKRFEPLFTTESALLPIMNHVDVNMFGSLPLLLYQITKEKRYLDLGLPYADTQWICPSDASVQQHVWADKGFSWQTRLWIDDMYMITVVQTQAYKVTGDRKYIDRAAKEMAMYLDSLQMPNGLFYHAPDVPFYWGRGNGWVAAGMADMLLFLPVNSPYRKRILKGYQKMMQSLKNFQQSNGLWNQLIDETSFWPETSGSAMFTYAFIQGVKNGWLPEKDFMPSIEKAWLALVSYINEKGDIKNVCEGTNKKNNKQYYFDRRRNTGDYHGQAPVLWCAVALLENGNRY